MKIGIVINETWAFFKEVYKDLEKHHTVSQFKFTPVNYPFFSERLNKSRFQRELKRFLRKNEVVFFEWSSELLAQATRLPKTTPIVTRMHRYEMYQWIDQIDWNKVDWIILVSEAKRREFADRFPDQAHKLVVIPESIAASDFMQREKRFNKDLGILCNLTPRKRVYELILAMADQGLFDEGYQLHVGGGEHPRFRDYFLALNEVVRRLNLEDKVHFYGLVRKPTEFYDKIDVFISNSYSEGLQVSPMEAMASGCYCLSHRWAGAEELLPDENLFYTDREFAQKVRSYAALPDNEKRAATAALRDLTIQRFDSGQISTRIRQLIELANAPHPEYPFRS